MAAVRAFETCYAAIFSQGYHVGVDLSVDGLLPAPAAWDALPVCVTLPGSVVRIGDNEIMVVEIHRI